MLVADWSPEQISGRLKSLSGSTDSMYVSHETIYKSLYIQTRNVFREELKKRLRTRRMFRHARRGSPISREWSTIGGVVQLPSFRLQESLPV
jgi:IS30 family transposase